MLLKKYSSNQVGATLKIVELLPFETKKNSKWTYSKNDHWTIYLLNSVFDENSESQRVIGHDIFNLLKDEIDSLRLEETKKNLIFIIEGIVFSSYEFKKLKTKDNLENKFNVIEIPDAINGEQIFQLEQVVNSLFWARDMVNLPLSHLNAEEFANHIAAFCELPNCKADILSQSKIESLKMGGLLAVNKGSVDPATFTVLEYAHPAAANDKPIVLVGKGVVYDTGGLSLKPTPGSMDSMKCDMAGAAMMVGAFRLAAVMNLPLKLVCLIPATDNRPGGNAYTPGDIITMYNGTTVEVLNTDAEGRMILADALSYAEKFNPEVVISAATLTGAALRAIGTRAAIAMGNAKKSVMSALIDAGTETHERVVEFPFWDEYLEDMKSPIADLKNIGGSDAGMITAGKFLETFLTAPYIHIDVAGPTWLDKPKDYKGLGGTGYGVRLMFNFLTKYNQWKKKGASI